ncbi:MAG: hypothetical protein CM1200mP30_21230 [Pseudomonadota bacterium]|nr:MAG: hypothetical protein CM1200mP30_21230 [Pseudomonadota bacterium]
MLTSQKDFNSLVETVLGLGLFPSYLQILKIFSLFFLQIHFTNKFSHNSLDFGFSATAMHWLRKNHG